MTLHTFTSRPQSASNCEPGFLATILMCMINDIMFHLRQLGYKSRVTFSKGKINPQNSGPLAIRPHAAASNCSFKIH
ncbi:hypothetical protein BLOT_008152 [Blomia tropicalis]|nr:hypothetical protein BLOT_008152 [Blomia tropicalis]